MADDSYASDTEIIRDAYAEKVREAFKVFAENLGMGQNQKSSVDRFMRSLDLVRKARDMALEAMSEAVVVEPPPHREPTPAAAEANATDAAAPAPVNLNGLSAEDQAIVEHALAGTTGLKPALRR